MHGVTLSVMAKSRMARKPLRVFIKSQTHQFHSGSRILSSQPESMTKDLAIEFISEASVPLDTGLALCRSIALSKWPSVISKHLQSKDSEPLSSIQPFRSQIGLNFKFKSSDSSVKDLRGSVVLPRRFMESHFLVLTDRKELLGDISGDFNVLSSENIENMLDKAKKNAADSESSDINLEMTKLLRENFKFDRVLASEEMAPILGKLARVLGPLGLMPTKKKGTLTNNISEAMNAQANAILFKTDHNHQLSCLIGRTDMQLCDIRENIEAFLNELKRLKFEGASSKKKSQKFVDKMFLQVDCSDQIVLIDNLEFKI